jgi:hypothetical protein
LSEFYENLEFPTDIQQLKTTSTVFSNKREKALTGELGATLATLNFRSTSCIAGEGGDAIFV